MNAISQTGALIHLSRQFIHVRNILILLVLLWASLPLQTARAAGIIFIDKDAPSAGQTGDNWEHAYVDLQSALAVAIAGDQLWVAEGVYKPGSNRTDHFTLIPGVSIYGGFAGSEGDIALRNWESHVTVLSGDIDNNDTVDGNGVVLDPANISGSNAFHVIYTSGGCAGCTLDGFIITAGQANGSSTDSYGGGAYIVLGNPTLQNLLFSGNLAVQEGGGVYNSNSSPTITAVSFSHNKAYLGGGLSNSVSSPTMTEVTFEYNTAPDGWGGGMSNQFSSHPNISSTGFLHNEAKYGGGMYNSQSSPILNTVVFYQNNSTWTGGGMHNNASTPSLTNVIFNGNTTIYYGGGLCNNDHSDASIINTFFWNNTASDGGSTGGGLANITSSPVLLNATIGGNHAGNCGGGMSSDNTSNSVVMNTIIWGNTGGLMPQICNVNSEPQIYYSDIQDSFSGTLWDNSLGNNGGHNIDLDPLFIDDLTGILLINPGSPVIDIGTNTPLISAGITSDLLGKPRIMNGTVDLGAFETYAYFYLPLIIN